MSTYAEGAVVIRLSIEEAEAVQYAAMSKCEWWRSQALLHQSSISSAKTEWIALAAAAHKIGEARIALAERMEKEQKPT